MLEAVYSQTVHARVIEVWTYLINRLREFHHIYNFGALVVDKDEGIRFWDQKVKDQGHNYTKCGKKSTFGVILLA